MPRSLPPGPARVLPLPGCVVAAVPQQPLVLGSLRCLNVLYPFVTLRKGFWLGCKVLGRSGGAGNLSDAVWVEAFTGRARSFTRCCSPSALGSGCVTYPFRYQQGIVSKNIAVLLLLFRSQGNSWCGEMIRVDGF